MNTSEMKISSKALLVHLRIGAWTATRTDAGAAKEIALARNAASSAVGRYTKLLVPKVALAEVMARANAARTFHRQYTLPWSDNGDRILPIDAYMEYMSEQSINHGLFNTAVNKLIAAMPMYIREAKSWLGDLWNPDDYPSADELAERYNFSVKVLPLADQVDSADLRARLTGDEVDAIEACVRDSMQERFDEATGELWSRLYKAVSAMHERLDTADAIFRDSLIGNLRDLVGLLPKLNFTNDPDLENKRQEIEAELCQIDAVDIRGDDAVRKEMADKAKELMDSMAGYAA